MASEQYDLVVIGGGPAGYTAASIAGICNKKVAIVEDSPACGGAGVFTGTVPSKTLRETALALSGLKTRKLHGIDLTLKRNASIEEFMRHEQRVTSSEGERIMELLRIYNVEFVNGWGSFLDPHTIEVKLSDGGTRQLRTARTMIATGSSPVRPATFDFSSSRIHDSDEILQLKELPKKLVVIGSGVIGSEYASTFAEIGCEVHIVDGRDKLLPFLDGEVSAALLRAMTDNGINFHWKKKVVECSASADSVTLTFDDNTAMSADGVLVAAGRSGNVKGLNLEQIGVKLGEKNAVLVNEKFETNLPHILAIGDVIGAPALASASAEQARVAMSLAYDLPFKTKIASVLPTGVYTIPEVGCAGATEEQLKTKGIEYLVGRVRYSDCPRGKIIGDEDGFLKLLFSATDRKLLGVHVIGEGATELVHLGVITMLSDAGFDLLNATCFNYPTLGELYRYATSDALITSMKLKR